MSDSSTVDPESHLPIYTVPLRTSTLTDLLSIPYWGENELPSDLRRLASMLIAATEHGMTSVEISVKRRWYECAAQSPLDAYFLSKLRASLDAELKIRCQGCRETLSRLI